MPRRKQFKSISHDVLESFISRYNDLNGYWALGQYVNFLQEANEKALVFDLKNGTTTPHINELIETTQFYWQFILNLMKANNMPAHWLSDAKITFSIEPWIERCCTIAITSDLNKIYSYQQSVLVQPHNPQKEQQRSKAYWGLWRNGQRL